MHSIDILCPTFSYKSMNQSIINYIACSSLIIFFKIIPLSCLFIQIIESFYCLLHCMFYSDHFLQSKIWSILVQCLFIDNIENQQTLDQEIFVLF